MGVDKQENHQSVNPDWHDDGGRNTCDGRVHLRGQAQDYVDEFDLGGMDGTTSIDGNDRDY